MFWKTSCGVSSLKGGTPVRNSNRHTPRAHQSTMKSRGGQTGGQTDRQTDRQTDGSGAARETSGVSWLAAALSTVTAAVGDRARDCNEVIRSLIMVKKLNRSSEPKGDLK